MAKILAFSGSTRKGSYNTKLVKVAAEGAKEAGVDVTVIDLADYPMPLFNADLQAEKGLPEAAQQFKQLLIEHDGFLIASPEYNSAFSPLLKNAIDWASRATEENEPPLVAYRGKYAAIMSTNPGALGGMRGLVFLRMLLGNIGITVIPSQQAVPHAATTFDDAGLITDEATREKVMGLGKALAVELLKK